MAPLDNISQYGSVNSKIDFQKPNRPENSDFQSKYSSDLREDAAKTQTEMEQDRAIRNYRGCSCNLEDGCECEIFAQETLIGTPQWPD